MPAQADDRVLIDFRTADDAGVYRIDGDRALVQTVDFFTPVVDDPAVYGAIAAANSLSDVYAMGGRPITALAIAGFPASGLDEGVVRQVFLGGFRVLRDAGVALLGGHTVQDQEIKFGYAVTGVVSPADVWANAGARAGDVLFLTKPIGSGVITTALKFGRAPSGVVDAAIEVMLELNARGADALHALPPGSVHGCTDITGFGFLGHAAEMAAASGVTFLVEAAAVPLIPGALALASNRSGGLRTNEAHFGPLVSIAPHVDAALAGLLFDPQTSGGLLASVDPVRAEAAAASFAAAGVAAARIGTVVPRGSHAVIVL